MDTYTRIWLTASLLMAAAAGCKTKSALYCDGPGTCSDPATPFCDLEGAFPASDGITNTCIPYPWDAGLDVPDAAVDAPNGDAAIDAVPLAKVEVVLAGTGTGQVVSDPAGIDCGQACSADFSVGTSVTLTASPVGDSMFDGWSGGGCSGTQPCTVQVPATVSATFIPITHRLTVTFGGDGTGQVTSAPSGINCGVDCSEAYPSGQIVTLSPIGVNNSVFMGWTGACAGQPTDCVVVMSSDLTATALFNKTCDPVAGDPGCGPVRGCYLNLTTGQSVCDDPYVSDPISMTGGVSCVAAPGGQGCNCTNRNWCERGYSCALNNEPMNATGLECAYLCDLSNGGGPTCPQSPGPGPSYTCRQIRTFYNNADNVPATVGFCVDPAEWPCAGCIDENAPGCSLSLPTDCDGDNT